MAGIDLATATAQLNAYIAAETAVLSGQEYTINGRKLVRADLAAIQAGITLWDQRVKRLGARSGGRSATITPRPNF